MAKKQKDLPPDAPKAMQRSSKPLCHPTRRYYADGKCRECYSVIDRGALSPQEKAELNELTELHREVEYLEGMARTARAILESRIPAYADLHFRAAEVAADKGDARPAEWALERVKLGKDPVVAPAAKTPADTGVKVMIGVRIDGQGGEIVGAGVISEPLFPSNTMSGDV